MVIDGEVASVERGCRGVVVAILDIQIGTNIMLSQKEMV